MKKVNPPCPPCRQATASNGCLKIKKRRKQKKYFCPHCKQSFNTFTNTVFHYLEALCDVVAWSLEFMQTFGLSLAQTRILVERLFKFSVSAGTLSLWNRKFNAASVELPRVEYSRVWHVDEMFIKHEQRCGKTKRVWFSYLWVVSDDKQNVIALHHSENRDLQAAKTVLAKAHRAAGFVPRVIVFRRVSSVLLRGSRGVAWSVARNRALRVKKFFVARRLVEFVE